MSWQTCNRSGGGVGFYGGTIQPGQELSEVSTKIASQASEPVQSHICDAVVHISDNVTNLPSKVA